MIGVGIDFGTSNSAAAWYDGQQVHLVALEEAAVIMPSATHLNRALSTLTGQAAVLQYVEENRDRMVELTPEVIAKTAMLTGEAQNPRAEAETATHNVYGQPWVDRGMPGRLFRGVKRLLGNASLRRVLVFDQLFRLVALITPILLRIRQSIEADLATYYKQPQALSSGQVEQVHFGHPVLFEGDADDPAEHRTELALERLAEACAHAGIPRPEFYPEPLAATLSYQHAAVSPLRGCVLTLDFGGGTLDLSVVEYAGSGFEVLATRGMPLGGDHIDQLIFRELLFPHLGKGESWSRTRDGRLIETEYPFAELEDKLLNWSVTYLLNQNQYRSKIAARIGQGGPGAVKFKRLLDLITHNYGYLVFQAIREAKVALSTAETTVMDIPELDLTIHFTRGELERMMQPMLESIDGILSEVLAGRGAEEIDQVIRTGGSSQIASVRRLLEARFPGRVAVHDPFTSVAAGLAIADYHGYRVADI